MSQSRVSVCNVRNVLSVGIKGNVINRGQLQTRTERPTTVLHAAVTEEQRERDLMLLLFSNHTNAISFQVAEIGPPSHSMSPK